MLCSVVLHGSRRDSWVTRLPEDGDNDLEEFEEFDEWEEVDEADDHPDGDGRIVQAICTVYARV